MPTRSREELLAALAADEWLRAGDLAIVLQLGRSTVHRLFLDGTIAWRHKAGGKQRYADPADVRRLLDEAEKTHRADDS